jgi:hypothetical protein
MSLHNGRREPNVDYFDDMEGKLEGGILGGLGDADFQNVKQYISPQGLVLEIPCQMCGRRHACTLEWHELFTVGLNGPKQPLRMPPGWDYSPEDGGLFAKIPCQKCQHPMCPLVTPDDARKHVNQAVQRGFLAPQQVEAWKAQVR